MNCWERKKWGACFFEEPMLGEDGQIYCDDSSNCAAESSDTQSDHLDPESHSSDDDDNENGHLCEELYIYDSMFADPESLFRSHFEDMFEDEAALGFNVPQLDHVIAPLPKKEASPPAPPLAQPTAMSDPSLVEEDPRTGLRYRIKHCKVSLCICNNEGAIEFDIPKTFNREQLRRQFQDDPKLAWVPTDSLWAGYIFGESSGTAVALLPDAQQQRSFLQVVSGSRPTQPTPHCYRPFMKEVRIHGKEEGPVAPVVHSAPKLKTIDVINNSELLRKGIAARGGLSQVHFVCFDMEAAVVLADALPLPLELAFVGERASTYHTFVHPGAVEDQHTARLLSTCLLPTGHGIPFKNCKFLRSDYSVLAQQVAEIVTDPKVILINKGSIADYNAIRWVLSSKDGEQVGEGPSFDLFDVLTLFEVLGIPEDHFNPDVYQACRHKHDCWYHQAIADDVVALGRSRPHCALADATALMDIVSEVLKSCRQ